MELIVFFLACTKHEVSHMRVSYTVKKLHFILLLDDVLREYQEQMLRSRQIKMK